MGSISWAGKFAMGSNQAYKVSKAALNMLNADLDVEVGVAELKKIILESGKAQNGKFLNIHFAGQENSWGQYDEREISW